MTGSRLLFPALAALLLASIALGLVAGRQEMRLSKAFPYDAASPDSTALFQIRIPRVLLAGLVGAALGLAGAVFQGVLRNDLATPFTLGISGGASFGAVLAIQLGLDLELAGLSPLPLAAFAGALAAVGALSLLARTTRSASTATLLLSGVTLNFLFAAGTMIVQYVADPYATAQMVRWSFGDLSVVGFRVHQQILPFWAVGLALPLAFATELDLLATGEEMAASRGVDVRRARRALLVGASLATASVLCQAGPIAFVGLVVPHALRRFAGPGHRRLLPASLLGGAAFLILADAASRSILRTGDLPIGILTALIGAPAFLWILHRSGSRVA